MLSRKVRKSDQLVLKLSTPGFNLALSSAVSVPGRGFIAGLAVKKPAAHQSSGNDL